MSRVCLESVSQETQNICITFMQRRPNVSTLAQHCINVIQMFCISWDAVGKNRTCVHSINISYLLNISAGVGLTGGELAGVVCALLILLIVFVVISGMLYWNMRRSTPKDNSDFRLTPRPPKFALSRIIPNQHI